MQSTRTPGRWIATDPRNKGIWHIDSVQGAGFGEIATCWGVDGRGQQNAEAIVHAVNCYDDLYVALCNASSFMIANGHDKSDPALTKAISAAIAKAENHPE